MQRLTVYRHFPDTLSLYMACSGLSYEQDPPPEPERWRAIPDPDERLRAALTDLYAYYRRNERLLVNVIRDAEVDPVGREVLRRRREGHVLRTREILSEGRPRRKAVRAAIAHATAFQTWRSLAREEGLNDRETLRLMLCLVRCA